MQTRNFLRACVLLLCVGLGGCGDDVTQLQPLAADAVVLAYGDSLTFGSGADPATSYPAVLQRLIGRTVISSGVPGEVSADGLARLPGVLAENPPKIVILCHGGNDLLRKLDPATTEQNLRSMVALVRQAGAQVLLVGVPKPSLILADAPFYEQLATSLQVPLLGGQLVEILGDRDLKADAAHPNARGYEQLAQALAELLRQTGAIQ
jgi:acyl-CoA thioesterase I